MPGKTFDKEVFAKRLTELMDANNETTYTMATHLHLSPPTISRYMSAEMSPKITAVESIADKFGVNLAWIMGVAPDDDKYTDVDKPIYKQIPIVGRIAAGQPLLVQENIEGYEYVSENSKATFCLKVNGDSMIDARIHNGDIVFIREQPDVENGEIAAVIIDGEEATLKRVFKYPGSVVLRPENKSYEELVFTKKDFKQVKIIGKCTAVKFWLE